MRGKLLKPYALAALLLLAPLGRAAFAQGAAAWQEFRSAEGGFTVKFPVKPAVEKIPQAKGPVDFTRHRFSATYLNYEFEVGYADLPAGYNEPELSLEGGISGMVNAMTTRGATVLTRGKILRGPCEGREATLSLPNPGRKPGFAQGRVFNSGQRYYFLIFVAGEDSQRARQTGLAFMDSFTVADGCAAPLAPAAAPSTKKTVTRVEGVADAATGWRKIESQEFGFSVLMPGGAERESEQAQVEPFPLMHHTFMREEPDAIFSAEVIGEYPPNFHASPTAYEALIDVTLYALKRNMGQAGFVMSAGRSLKVGAMPGREFDLSSEAAEARGRGQIFVTSKYVYIFIAFTRGKDARSGLLDRFFSSIRVSPK